MSLTAHGEVRLSPELWNQFPYMEVLLRKGRAPRDFGPHNDTGHKWNAWIREVAEAVEAGEEFPALPGSLRVIGGRSIDLQHRDRETMQVGGHNPRPGIYDAAWIDWEDIQAIRVFVRPGESKVVYRAHA